MNYKDINKKQLHDLLIHDKDILLLDIRTEDEFLENHIKGSINIPLNELLFNIDELSEFKNKPIIVYCRSGHRSITACNLLNMEGFDNLYNLKYGIIE